MITEIKKQVFEMLKKENSGHGVDHIERVLRLSLKFARNENANEYLVALIALLHDVDDYKMVGRENAENLTNAKRIMQSVNLPMEIEEKVLQTLQNLGYSKRLQGKSPSLLEGKIVSDADMCDAMGVNGVLRTHMYGIKCGTPFFDRGIFPAENITFEEYSKPQKTTSVCHFFEKILKLKNLMLTDSGKREAVKRNKIVIDILYNYFAEEGAEEWIAYLSNFLLLND